MGCHQWHRADSAHHGIAEDRPADDVARSDFEAAHSKASQARNDIAFKLRQLYCSIGSGMPGPKLACVVPDCVQPDVSQPLCSRQPWRSSMMSAMFSGLNAPSSRSANGVMSLGSEAVYGTSSPTTYMGSAATKYSGFFMGPGGT